MQKAPRVLHQQPSSSLLKRRRSITTRIRSSTTISRTTITTTRSTSYDDEEREEDEEEEGEEEEQQNSLILKKFNVALAFDDENEDEDERIAKRFLVSSFYRMAAANDEIIHKVYIYNKNSNNNTFDSDGGSVKTVVLDFRKKPSNATTGNDEGDGDMVKYVAVDDTTLVGKKRKLVSLLPPGGVGDSSDDGYSDDIEDTISRKSGKIHSLLKLITVNVLQNKNVLATTSYPPHDFLAHHLFAASLGAFKKRSGALNARRKIKEEYMRLCLKRVHKTENNNFYYIFFNLNSQTSKWNALQAYESLSKNSFTQHHGHVIPVALVYGDSKEENIERSTFVWIFDKKYHINDFYQCVYSDNWREAETLVFGKKNNKNTWPERFRKDLLLEFPKEKEEVKLKPSIITVAAFAQGVAKSSVVFIAPNMSEKNNNHKSDCTLRKLFQSAGITFTGTSAAFATRAADRVFLSSALNNSKVKIPGVMGIPKKVILRSALAVMAEEYVEKNEFSKSVSNIQRAVRTYAEATKELNCAELCIKSQFFEKNSENSSVTRIQSAKDLETFAYECRYNKNQRFSSNSNIQNNFILEPFVETGKVVLSSSKELRFQFVQRDEQKSGKTSLSESRWLKIYAGGIGPEGKMKALDPTCPVEKSSENKGKTIVEYAYLDCVTDGKTKKLLFDEKKIESVVKARIERILNLTGISGVAILRCFVNVDSGELIVEDVDHSPDMTERSGTFYHQALRYFHREELDNDERSSSDMRENDDKDEDEDDVGIEKARNKIAAKGLENTSFFTRLIAIAMFK
jgi:hypothetical protein